VKPEFPLSPEAWTQLAPGADLVVTWDASAVPSFSSIGVLIGTARGDSDIATGISVDSTDSLTVPFASLPDAGLFYVTAYLDCGASAFVYDRVVRSATWPPHTKEFAELADRFAVETALAAVETAELQAVAGAGWLGMDHYDVGDPGEGDLTSTGDASAPRMWGRWKIEYGNPPVVCFDDSDIVTDGVVVFVIFQEAGTSTAIAQAALALFRIALKDFEHASGQAHVFFTEAQTNTNRDPQLLPYVAVVLAVPFRGL
jgi:hypothetical protein